MTLDEFYLVIGNEEPVVIIIFVHILAIGAQVRRNVFTALFLLGPIVTTVV